MLALLAACSDRYGAYFTIEGHDAIQFDRVDFYFGEEAGMKVPVPPGHTATEPEPGLLMRRQGSDSDVVSLEAKAGSLTYWVPPGGDNDKLGNYVLAIAYAGDKPVGIAELFDFAIPTDEAVYKYELPLVPYANEMIEMWGRPTQDCIRYKRDRGTNHPALVAMTRDNDVDCDAFVDKGDMAADCEPLRYCDGSGNAGCIGASACVTLGDGCRIGACQNKDGQTASCAPVSCVVDAACANCDLDAPPSELLQCVLFVDGTHIDYPITVKPSQALCIEPYKVYLVLPTGVSCENPKIETAVNWMPGAQFNYQIASAGSTCLLTLAPPMPGLAFEGIPHIMISIDSPGGPTPRQTFIIGLSTTVDACPTEQTVVVDPPTVSCSG
jgi:hypothetical protein